MDDFNVNTLYESKNEWSARLVNILVPVVVDGYKSMLNEAIILCKKNNELEKYLMTFQNFISRVPKWNATIIETERKRIVEKSGCNYLDDLITCVHVIQLKVLSAMRVGQKQKKIDIHVPKLDDFIHKVYVNSARKVYKNVYLFEMNIPPLMVQKNERELEKIIQECILFTLRESIPLEEILKAYMSETVEEIIVDTPLEEPVKKEEPLNKPLPLALDKSITETITNPNSLSTNESSSQSIRFNDVDNVKLSNDKEEQMIVPKTIEHLEKISDERYKQRKLEQDSDDDDNIKLTIHDDLVSLPELDIQDLREKGKGTLEPDFDLELDFETLN
jgi:hypothetical protein